MAGRRLRMAACQLIEVLKIEKMGAIVSKHHTVVENQTPDVTKFCTVRNYDSDTHRPSFEFLKGEKMTKHTPAPWKVDEQTGIVYVELISGREPAICHTQSSQTETLPFDVSIANARLIAAAPELLEALQAIIEIGKRDLSNKKYDSYFETARAAIAKAKGES